MGGKACLLIRKHDHFTPTREIERHVRALARNNPEGWKLKRHVTPTSSREHSRGLFLWVKKTLLLRSRCSPCCNSDVQMQMQVLVHTGRAGIKGLVPK